MEDNLIIWQRSSHVDAIYGNRMRVWMECQILTSKNSVKLNQYYFHAKSLEVQYCHSLLVDDLALLQVTLKKFSKVRSISYYWLQP